MEVRSTPIPGCHEIIVPVRRDDRGEFVKVLNSDDYARHGLLSTFAEVYYSVSRPKVLRGLHFQTPPFEHTKLVYCASGGVMDVLLDLRVDSPAFGKSATFELSSARGNILYIATGVAHGFYVANEPALMVYHVTTVYSASHDAGVRWDSAGIPWPDSNPVISDRDRKFPTLAEFKSPFRYVPDAALCGGSDR